MSSFLQCTSKLTGTLLRSHSYLRPKSAQGADFESQSWFMLGQVVHPWPSVQSLDEALPKGCPTSQHGLMKLLGEYKLHSSISHSHPTATARVGPSSEPGIPRMSGDFKSSGHLHSPYPLTLSSFLAQNTPSSLDFSELRVGPIITGGEWIRRSTSARQPYLGLGRSRNFDKVNWLSLSRILREADKGAHGSRAVPLHPG